MQCRTRIWPAIAGGLTFLGITLATFVLLELLSPGRSDFATILLLAAGLFFAFWQAVKVTEDLRDRQGSAERR